MNDNSLKPLTENEIQFANDVFNGTSYSEAYAKLYPEKKQKWEATSFAKEASNYAKRPQVQKCLKQLKEQLQKEGVKTLYDKLEILEELIDDINIKPSDRIRAIDTHNKMTGDIAALKVEQSGKLQLEHSVNPDVLDAFKKHLKK